MPSADLLVTRDHGLVFGDVIINVSALLNGTTVAYEPTSHLPHSYFVYHIETENHDVILANGTPAETFVDAAGRAAFDNYDEYLALYGAERIIPESPMPRITSARLLPETLKQRLGLVDNFDAAWRVAG